MRISILFLLACVVLPGFSAADTGDPVLINEILAYHLAEPEDSEFIELYGTPFTSLDGLSLIEVHGFPNWPVLHSRMDFGPEHELGPNGFFLLGNPVGLAAHYGVTPDVSFGANYFYNSAITVALVETSSLTSVVGEEISFAEVARDAIGLNSSGSGNMFYYSAPVLGPTGGHFPAGVRRHEDGVDTNRRVDWAFASYEQPGVNTPTPSGPAVTAEPSTWGQVKSIYR